MIRKDVSLLAFDLDGTLSQHRSPIDPENRKLLSLLSENYRLVLTGAGQAPRIFEQLEHFPMDIIGNYGMQQGEYDEASGSLKITKNIVVPCDRESVSRRMDALRMEHGFTAFAGESVEFHPTGCVTLALLGTKARIEDKLVFDPDRKIRSAFYEEVVSLFPEYNVYLGGSSSFDMSPKPYDKAYALTLYCEEKGIPLSAVHYFGDDFGPGGNDESVLYAGIGFFNRIKSYKDFPKIAGTYL